jgi:hypothetical protein
MQLRKFIKENRKLIDEIIHEVPGAENLRLNDNDREYWIRNDETLYTMARLEGCRP